MVSTFYTRFGKRCFDAAASFIGLLILSPLFLVVAAAVRLSSPGPALFSQIRTGWRGEPFYILKFRSMRVSDRGDGSFLTATGDPRITPLGHWLRKTKIDELPQLLNVLIGDMSLVGPRPEVPHFTAGYTERQKEVLQVKPGITCPRIEFDEEELLANSEQKENFYVATLLPAKLEADLTYCENIQFWRDLKIVLQTVGSVFDRIGSHTRRTLYGNHPPTSVSAITEICGPQLPPPVASPNSQAPSNSSNL